LTTSPSGELLGVQVPRIRVVPPAASSAGDEAVDLAASCGLALDPWQQLVLRDSLGERPDGRWSAFEVGLIVGRQNGKGSILEAREVAGLYLFGEQLIIHSAHEFKTSKEAFRRILTLIEQSPDLDARVRRVSRSHGEEGIELKGGARLLFATRTGGGGRGFSGDLVVLDEAYNLSDAHMDALLPTLSARPNPQIWYTSSAPDKNLAPCEALASVRRRAMDGQAPRVAFFEWSADPHTEACGSSCTAHDDDDDPVTWAKANPGMGIRISEEFVRGEVAALSVAGFRRERLSVGNYPSDGSGWDVIGEDSWSALAAPESQPRDVVAFGLDVNPERSMGCIGVAGVRPDGLHHIEVVEHRVGTTWMVDRAVELHKRWRPAAIVVGNFGAAASLIADLEAAGLTVIKASTGERAAAAGALHDAMVRPPDAPGGWRATVRHLSQPALDAAMAAAVKQFMGKDGAFVWGRNSLSADISPLVAVSQALWGFRKFGARPPVTPFALVGGS
jgi:hypothetical protein